MSMEPKKVYVNPLTGDELTKSEYISWKVQGVIRRWAFIGFITVASITVFLIAASSLGWASPLLLAWNLGASYLAVFIESVVGIAMFSQTARDANIIRKIDKIAAHIEAQEDQELEELKEILKALIAKSDDL